jgi:hypothetical protein
VEQNQIQLVETEVRDPRTMGEAEQEPPLTSTHTPLDILGNTHYRLMYHGGRLRHRTRVKVIHIRTQHHHLQHCLQHKIQILKIEIKMDLEEEAEEDPEVVVRIPTPDKEELKRTPIKELNVGHAGRRDIFHQTV